jgi:hypothetical protein
VRLALLVLVAGCSVSQSLAPTGDGGLPITIGFERDASIEDEASGTVMVPVSLSEPTSIGITVDFQIRDGSATRDLDYETPDGTDGTLSFAAGEKTKYVVVKIIGDNNEEGDETIELHLKSANGAKLAEKDHTITINSDILPRVRFTLAASKALETVPQQFNLALDIPSPVEVRVDFTLTGLAKAPEDYTLASGTVIFPPNVTTQQIDFVPVDDMLDEDPEDVIVTLTNPIDVIIKPTEGVRTHVLDDNDPTPTIAFTQPSSTVTEGPNVTVTMTLQLSAVSGRAITVPFEALVPGTNGASATDYTYTTQSPLTIAPGTASTTIVVTIENDDLDEFAESFSTIFGTLTNVTAGSQASYGISITDEDPLPTVMFDPLEADGAALEDAAADVTYKVKLSTASGKPVTVPVLFTGTSETTVGTDYTRTGVPVMFAPGDTEKLITIDVVADVFLELDETIDMTIVDATITNATAGTPATRTHTITNDD